jgi:XRE family transcriptional regulator, aerobic/anaerobic benzoate catabolism transcriptional regulator
MTRRHQHAEPEFLHQLGETLRTLRARRGMTRKALAEQSGVSERYIAQMEAGSGNASLLVARALATALGVSITQLLAPLEAEQALADRLLGALLARLSPHQRQEARALLAARFGEGEASLRGSRVALIGLRGAGKSTLGRMLAKHQGIAFHELDREIEAEARMGLSELFELHGQAGFRRLERAVLERLLATGNPFVLATGGSIVADPATFALLLEGCHTVWVRATPEEHMARVVAQGDMRPMQDNRQAMADLHTILAAREPLYARADLTLDTAGRSAGESFADLVRLLDIQPRGHLAAGTSSRGDI